ncbi:hypothetical protein BCY92_17055 [Bacillus wiedmannii]|uniref:glycosyltransferase family 4 protein n=1 Tax=Bacillus wiedmannii TaxID=1890302 RepID=UPI000FEFE85B|nr:hypothetical protein BCY92_17055 [Bacillus wiedmannii]
MKAAFFHDFPAYEDEKKNFYSIGFPYSLWQRYLEIFSHITVGSRARKFENQEEKFKKNLQTSSGENVTFQPIYSYNSHKSYLTKHLTIRKEITDIIDDVECVIVRLPSVIGNIAYKEARNRNKKVIVEMVACPWDALWNYGSLKTRIAAPIMFLKTRKNIKSAQNVIYVTNQFLQKRYPNNKNNIGCSDVEIANVTKSILSNKLKNNLESSKVIKIGLIGNANNRFKGHDTALKAISSLSGKYSNIKLHLLGHGDSERLVQMIDQEKLGNNIVFDGIRKSGAGVWEWLDEMDIYIQPSLQEGMNRATIEAMSRACPVITTDVGGFPEIVREDFIIQKRDHQLLAQKIDELINNHELYKSACLYNYNKAGEFSKDSLDTTREEFFKSCLDN